MTCVSVSWAGEEGQFSTSALHVVQRDVHAIGGTRILAGRWENKKKITIKKAHNNILCTCQPGKTIGWLDQDMGVKSGSGGYSELCTI